MPPTPTHIQRSVTAELWDSGRYRELSSHLLAELMTAESTGDWDRWITATNNLACTYRALNDSDAASRFQYLATLGESQVQRSRTQYSATTLSNLACDAILAGQTGPAEALLWKSLLMELACGNDSGAAADWGNLGLLAASQGHLEAAVRHLWEAVKLHHRLSDHHGLGLDLMHLGQICELQCHWKRAANLFQRAASRFSQVGNADRAHVATTAARLNAARAAVVKFDTSRN